MVEWQSLLDGLEITDGAVAGLSASDKPVLEGKLLQLPAVDRPLSFFVGQPLTVLKRLRTLLPDEPSDRIRLDGHVVVLKRGQNIVLPLFKRRGDPAILQKNGKAAGRLLLLNINTMDFEATTQIKVVDPEEERTSRLFPMGDGNGLSEQLFMNGTVIQVSPFEDLDPLDGIVLGILANCRALLRGTLSYCSAFAQRLKLSVAHGHSD